MNLKLGPGKQSEPARLHYLLPGAGEWAIVATQANTDQLSLIHSLPACTRFWFEIDSKADAETYAIESFRFIGRRQ